MRGLTFSTIAMVALFALPSTFAQTFTESWTLKAQVATLNEQCAGQASQQTSRPDMQPACIRRNALADELRQAGWCWVTRDGVEPYKFWERCERQIFTPERAQISQGCAGLGDSVRRIAIERDMGTPRRQIEPRFLLSSKTIDRLYSEPFDKYDPAKLGEMFYLQCVGP
jgi:hypothetical protein